MSKAIEGRLKDACLFDNSKECPARKASPTKPWDLTGLAKIVCPICPIRLKMIQKEEIPATLIS